MSLRIAWGITGSGDLLEETIEVMEDLSDRYDLNIRIFLSNDECSFTSDESKSTLYILQYSTSECKVFIHPLPEF
jgi:soluble P-type ATPase